MGEFMFMFKHRAARAALVTASVAAALAASTGAGAARAASAQPSDDSGACAPANAAWSTTSRETAYQHGPFVINSNQWNAAGGGNTNTPPSWMTTWAGHDSSWGVCAHEGGTGYPYPEERLPLQNVPVSALASITSGYSDTTPSDAQYDSAYDVWMKKPSSAPGKTPPEVMIWTTNHGEWTGNKKVVGTMTIAGHRYQMSVCDACNRISFVFPSNVPATTVNILAVLKYAARNPASSKIIGKNPVITEIDRGWEIFKTNGTEAFTAHRYWLSMIRKRHL